MQNTPKLSADIWGSALLPAELSPELASFLAGMRLRGLGGAPEVALRVSAVGGWAFSRLIGEGHVTVRWDGAPRVETNYALIVHVRAGLAARTAASQRVRSGAITLERAGVAGEVRLSGSFNLLLAHAPRRAVRLPRRVYGVAASAEAGPGAVLAAALRAIEAEAAAGAAAQLAPALPGLASLAMATFLAPQPTEPDWTGALSVGAIRELMRDAFGDPAFDLAAAASALRTSPRTLQRVLANEGLVFSQELRRLRLDHAARLLAASPGRGAVGRVARACGYKDPTAFARAFRARFGVGPGAWRSGARA